jgi:hypothetical protein
VERAFKRQNISIQNEITEFASKYERLRFAIFRDSFDAEIGVRYVRRVEWSRRSVRCRNISIRNEITQLSSKFERLGFAICRDSVDAEICVHYLRRVECSGKTV